MASSDSESSESSCPLCRGDPLGLMSCKNCSVEVCVNCQVADIWLYSCSEGKGQYTVCSICAAYSFKLESFIETEQLKWCVLTPRGKGWFERSGAKAWSLTQNGIEAYFEVTLGVDDLEMIHKDVDTGRSDPETHNWEIRETLLRIIGKDYREDIKKVLKAYCVKNNKVGYCQGMNIVTVWLLLFFDHNTAFLMLCYLIEKWLLPDFYIGARNGNSLNGFYIESTVIAGLLEHLMPSIKTSSIPSNEFADFFSLQHLIQMFVSTVDIETTVFFWDKLCEEGSIALIRGVVCLITISEKAIKEGTHPLHILKLLNDNRIAPQVKDNYLRLSFEINSERVTRLRKLARDYRAKQWLKCEKLVIKKLENVSNFTNDEIQALQVQFNTLMRTRKGSVPAKIARTRRPTVQLPASLQEKMQDYQGSTTIGISKPEFLEMISKIAPSLTSRSSDLFDKFDEDASGYLDFRELTIAMSVLSKGDFEDKLRICFEAYDSDHSGYLQNVELQCLIEKVLSPYTDQIEKDPESKELKATIVNIHQKMMKLGQTSNGKISFSDFHNGIKADMLLYNCISEYIGTERKDVGTILEALSTGPVAEEPERHACRLCNIF